MSLHQHGGHGHACHAHGHGHAGHARGGPRGEGDTDAGHRHRASEAASNALGWSLLIVFGFGLVEIVVGLVSGSLALVSDGVHMLTDSFALAIAWGAQRLARRSAGPTLSFGWGQVEPLAAFTNALFYLVVLVFIVQEAVGRIVEPTPIDASLALPVAVGGLLVNAAVWRILHGSSHRLNDRAALLHVIGDFAASLVAIVAILTAHFTGWTRVDPLLSLLIAALLLLSAGRLLRDSGRVLLNGVPAGLDSTRVGQALGSIDGVDGFHDLHLWSIGDGEPALAAHVQVRDMAEWPRILDEARTLLNERFGISHTTLQAESATDPCVAASADCGADDRQGGHV